MEIKDTGERLIVNEDFLNEPMYLRHMAAYIFAKKYISGRVVLDSGSGSGYGSYYLATNGAAKVTGIDVSQEATAYSKNRYKNQNLEFETSDVSNLKYTDETFDVITSFQVIEHLKDPDIFLDQTRRVLKQGGIALISTPNKQTYSPETEHPENPFHEREFYYDEFKNLAEKHFGNVEIRGVNQSARAMQVEKQLEHGLYTKMERIAESFKLTVIYKKIVPLRLRKMISPANRKTIDISDYNVGDADPEHSLDFIAICKKI